MSRSATDRGYLLVDRHVEKNAGSTYRELLFQAESRGLCMYWGYQQRSTAWTKFVPLMRKLSPDAVAPRICMEAHSHIDHVIPWLDRLEHLKALRKELAARMDIILLMRLREPLSHYISYYLWTVVERQARAPERFGTSFEQWARQVPNLQTDLMLSSKHAFTASFAPLGHKDLEAWKARWGPPNGTLWQERRALALRVAKAFDVLGTTERFNEASLLIARRLNWSIYDAAPPSNQARATPQAAETCNNRRNPSLQRMWWCRVRGRDQIAEKKRVHARVCPDMAKCRALVREIAPVDHELYDLAVSHLNAAVAAAGDDFAKQLAELKKLIALGRALSYHVTKARPSKCMWRPLRPYILGGPKSEANDRRLVWERAPNYTSEVKDVCVVGDNEIMRTVWGEHRQGGRVATGWPMLNLVAMRRRNGGGKGGGGGGFGKGAGKGKGNGAWAKKLFLPLGIAKVVPSNNAEAREARRAAKSKNEDGSDHRQLRDLIARARGLV